MSIVAVSVKRKASRQVFYMPYWVVDQVVAPEACAVISISDTDSEVPDLSNFQSGVPVLYFKRAENVDLDKILAFIAQHQPKNVIVHCSMGMQRSPWVAKHLIGRCGYQLAEGISLAEDGYWATERFEQNKGGF